MCYYPATINSAAQSDLALAAARALGLQASVAPAPAITSEDFAFMSQWRPGACLWLGQSRESDDARLHHPSYDFNDAALGHGVAGFCAVAEACWRRFDADAQHEA